MLSSIARRLFRRRPKSIIEKLEENEEKIFQLETARSTNIDTEKRFVFRLLVYSFIIFGLSFILLYYYYWPTSQYGKVVLTLFLVLYPSVVYCLKWLFRSIFLRRVNRTDSRLKSLRKEKQKLLEEVMETETFNSAQKILKRFDPISFNRLSIAESDLNRIPKSAVKTKNEASNLTATGDNTATDNAQLKTFDAAAPSTPLLARTQRASVESTTPVLPRLQRPILPRERSLFTRLVDKIIGDGPNERYALICQECASHNGMALKEEFEYLAFRCCYCSHFNPPRRTKRKPQVPFNIASPKTDESSDPPQTPNEQELPVHEESTKDCDDISTMEPTSSDSQMENKPATD